MNKRWIALFAIVTLLAAAITGGAVMAQETGGGEDTAPKTILGHVATILGLEEAAVEDAFQQARKDQRTQAYRVMLDRRVEKGYITSEEAEEQYLWFQSRPNSLAGSFGRGGQQRPGFGHARFFRSRHGGRWRGLHGGFSRWNKHHGQESGQEEVVPSEPSSEPAPTSQ